MKKQMKLSRLQRWLVSLFAGPRSPDLEPRFSDLCTEGKRGVRSVAGKTFAQAWKSASDEQLDALLAEFRVKVPTAAKDYARAVRGIPGPCEYWCGSCYGGADPRTFFKTPPLKIVKSYREFKG